MKTILVGLDGSPVAPEVLDRAAALARSMDADLVLLRAVGVPLEMPEEAFRSAGEELATVLLGAARSDLTRLVEAIPAGVRHRVRVELGTPWRTICQVARDENAAVIVIGSHGHSALDRLLGTTATRVVNHADRDVLVVRSRANAEG